MLQSFTKIYKTGLLIIFFGLMGTSVNAQKTDTLAKKTLQPSQGQKVLLTVRGTILDAAAQKPVSGISVGSLADAAITDNKGNFSVKVPSLTSVLNISGPGYLSKEISIKGREKIVVVLYEDTFNSLYSVAEMPFEKKALNTLSNSANSINVQGSLGIKPGNGRFLPAR